MRSAPQRGKRIISQAVRPGRISRVRLSFIEVILTVLGGLVKSREQRRGGFDFRGGKLSGNFSGGVREEGLEVGD